MYIPYFPNAIKSTLYTRCASTSRPHFDFSRTSIRNQNEILNENRILVEITGTNKKLSVRKYVITAWLQMCNFVR